MVKTVKTAKTAKPTKKSTKKVTKAKKETVSTSGSTKKNRILILESPNKVASVKKYLGAGWRVVATVGHIVELSDKKNKKKKTPVDKDWVAAINTKTWEAKFEVSKSKQSVVDNLKKEVKNGSEIYLATDPDREGEAIAWFVYEQTKKSNPKAKFYRAAFNAITKDAIFKAIDNKSVINMDIVHSQRTRQFLDRLLGYTISPIVQKNVAKMEKHHAAGRVMSVALKILADRQREIDTFKPEEFWNISIDGVIDNNAITFALAKKGNKPIKITNQKQAIEIKQDLLNALSGELSQVLDKAVKRNPKPPLTTVSMQQLASTKLGFQVKTTMNVAQELFSKGYISYHRSDSVRLEPEEVKKAQDALLDKFGAKYIANPIIQYKSKSRSKVQDAHTAIQPTDAMIVKIQGDTQAQKLYDLIRKRFLACQSVPAEFKRKSLTVTVGDYSLKATATTLLFDGFLKVMGKDDEGEDMDATMLPDVKKGAKVTIKDVDAEQKFTKPPAYYNDASLVKNLEADGVGRPSTYAGIIDKLIFRNYIKRDKKKLVTTEFGCTVTDFLAKEFSDIFNIKFTSQMEDLLDQIEDGKQDWKKILDKFWKDLSVKIKSSDLKTAKLEETGLDCHLCGKRVMKSSGGFHGVYYICEEGDCKARFDKITGEPIILKIVGVCPNCGKDVVEKTGKRGDFFYACTGYPECKTICELNDDGSLTVPKLDAVGECLKCKSPVIEKKGRFGFFLACSNYPKCKTIYEKDDNNNLIEKVKGSKKGTKNQISVGKCPKCNSDIYEKKGKYGTFFSCSGYPKCKTIFEKDGNNLVEKGGAGKIKKEKSK